MFPWHRHVLFQFLVAHSKLNPLGRVGQSRDVTSAILFLASEEASWVTGVVLPVDGGTTLLFPTAKL